jgi:23S rRNA (uridine2479-2'-O)-methyltransferase
MQGEPGLKGRTVRVRSADATFQHADVLKRNRVRRQQCRAFVVEGVRPIERLLAAGWEIESLWWCPDRPLSRWARGVVERARAPRHYHLTPALMAELSDKEDTSEILAIARMPPEDTGRIAWRPELVALAFDRPSSPGNLGTLVRSADAMGAHGVIVTGHAADPYDPRAIRASLGSLFTLPLVRLAGAARLAEWLAALPVRPTVVGTDSGGEVDLWEAELRPPLVLVAGNEAAGMSRGMRDLCDLVVRVPVEGSADSLNVTVATSIALYEIRRQRGAGLP